MGTTRIVEGPVKNRVVLNPPPFGVEDPSSESDPEGAVLRSIIFDRVCGD